MEMTMEKVMEPIEPIQATRIEEACIPHPEIVEEVKPYTFRKLSSKDVFLMFKIVSAIGINEFAACLENGSVLKAITAMSDDEKESESGAMMAASVVLLEVGNVILANLPKCEKEIYQLLSSCSNMTTDQLTAEGNAVMFIEMVIDFFKKEEFPAFFKVVSKLFK